MANDLVCLIHQPSTTSISETEYPFPSGVYHSRLISLVQKWPNRVDDPLIELVCNNYIPPSNNNNKKGRANSVFGNRYAKEITESMAMVDAAERAMKLCLGRSTSSFSKSVNGDCCVRVYCVGDGKYPVTAATMALNYPHPGWEFISIDPLLQHLTINTNPENHQHRLIQVTGISQDYQIPPLPPPSSSSDYGRVQYVDLLVACHSHAPLQEIWDRIVKRNSGNGSCRAIAITMACCANYSDLNQEPNLVFDDYEVYSPKREIRIYNDFVSCPPIDEAQEIEQDD